MFGGKLGPPATDRYGRHAHGVDSLSLIDWHVGSRACSCTKVSGASDLERSNLTHGGSAEHSGYGWTAVGVKRCVCECDVDVNS